MSKLRVHCFSVSVDGYAAGPNQSLVDPIGVGGMRLHDWFRKEPKTKLEESLFAAMFDGVGAFILGRNMFGPVRGPWPNEEWRGWWGPTPPYHTPVFVLTHYARESIMMEGGTSFHFVTAGVEEALDRAREAAGGRDVTLGGGVSTVQYCLRARLIDQMHVAVSPVLLGAGERLFDHMPNLLSDYELPPLGFGVAAHYRLTRR